MKLCVCLFACAGVLGFSGCSDQDLKLQDQIVELRMKLEESEKAVESANQRAADVQQRERKATTSSTEVTGLRQQLAEAQRRIAELEKTGATSPNSVPQVSDAILRANYEAATKALESEISKHPGYSIESLTMHKVEVPQEAQWPFRSKIAVNLRGEAGNLFTLSAPVYADHKGSWKFPTFKELLTAGAQSAATAAVPVPPPSFNPPQPVPTPVVSPVVQPPSAPVTEKVGPNGERIPVIDIGLPPNGR